MTQTKSTIDCHIGDKIRLLRKERGWSQKQLALELGISFQQLQKYESGENRMSAARLWELSQKTNTDIHVFLGEESQKIQNIYDIQTKNLLRQFHRLSPHARTTLMCFLESL